MNSRRPRLLIFTLAACAPAIGMVIAAVPAASAATTGHHVSARAEAMIHARDFIRHLKIGQHGTDQSVHGYARGINGLTQYDSTNWSGYADDNTAGNTYSKVTATWTEPGASCTSRTESLAAFWVGIDGFTSDSVEQDGTLIECYRRAAYYYTWWEMYPTNDIQVVGETLQPGDSISASVVRSGSSYTLAVTDSSRSGDSFTTTQTCSSCANSSAEWIAEAPSSSSGVLPLADFGTWTASNATVASGSTSGVISTFPDDEITMVDSSGLVKAQPGPLNGSGNGFTVTFERST
jgi:hypothetical protein